MWAAEQRLSLVDAKDEFYMSFYFLDLLSLALMLQFSLQYLFDAVFDGFAFNPQYIPLCVAVLFRWGSIKPRELEMDAWPTNQPTPAEKKKN